MFPYIFDIFAIAVVWTGLPEMMITRLGNAKNRGMIIAVTMKNEFINNKCDCSSLFPKCPLICFILTQSNITFLKLTGPDIRYNATDCKKLTIFAQISTGLWLN